jgi:hypothetical protein
MVDLLVGRALIMPGAELRVLTARAARKARAAAQTLHGDSKRNREERCEPRWPRHGGVAVTLQIHRRQSIEDALAQHRVE